MSKPEREPPPRRMSAETFERKVLFQCRDKGRRLEEICENLKLTRGDADLDRCLKKLKREGKIRLEPRPSAGLFWVEVVVPITSAPTGADDKEKIE